MNIVNIKKQKKLVFDNYTPPPFSLQTETPHRGNTFRVKRFRQRNPVEDLKFSSEGNRGFVSPAAKSGRLFSSILDWFPVFEVNWKINGLCGLIDMFKFWGSQEQQADPKPQEVPTSSWYPPSVLSSPSSSRPTTPNTSNSERPGDRPHSSSRVSPAEAANIIIYLKDKSVDELRKLLSDKGAYQQFLHSIDLVRTQNNVRDELRNETLQLARENLEKEPRMMELRNQCTIIRTTELAAAQEKLNDLTKRKAEILKSYSPASLLHQLQESMEKTDQECEMLHNQLLEKEIDLATFVQKYKKLRVLYHRRALTHLAANTSLTG